VEPDFWHKKWEDNVIGFHISEANHLLVNHFALLGLPKSSRVFVPLCGKTLDIHWLLENGHRVVGVELSEIAVKQLFSELNLRPTVTQKESLIHYISDDIDIFLGDIFQLTKALIGPVDVTYDRAAYVALPLEMRQRYSQHVIEITANATQLLITFEYDQSLQQGPPFSISNQEVSQHYHQAYDMTLLTCEALEGGLKGKCPAAENVWKLKRR